MLILQETEPTYSLRLDNLSPYIIVTQALCNIIDYSLIAYIHELTPSSQQPYELSVTHFIVGKIRDRWDQVTCLSSHPDVRLQRPCFQSRPTPGLRTSLCVVLLLFASQ